MTATDDDSRGPAVRVPPPLIALAVILASIAIDRLAPLAVPLAGHWKTVGAAVVIAGLAIIGASALSFYRARTAIEPWQPTSRIISTGVFRWSRNPIYLAFLVVQVGAGLYAGNAWMVLATPLTAVLLVWLAIGKEERYLERKFGAEYTAYKDRVRRWL